MHAIRRASMHVMGYVKVNDVADAAAGNVAGCDDECMRCRVRVYDDGVMGWLLCRELCHVRRCKVCDGYGYVRVNDDVMCTMRVRECRVNMRLQRGCYVGDRCRTAYVLQCRVSVHDGGYDVMWGCNGGVTGGGSARYG